jgi:hypothetical protein
VTWSVNNVPLTAQEPASMHRGICDPSYGGLEDLEILWVLQDESGHAPASRSN